MFFEEFALYKSPIQSIPYILVSLESLRICFIGIQKQQKGATIIFWGQLVTIIAYLGLYSSDISFLLFQKIINVPFVFQIIAFVIHLTASPITIAYLIAKDFVNNSKSLEKKIIEVESLSIEKQQILAAQNELLEQQVEARTAELRASQNQLIQKEKLASLGELTAGIAHEIQNPLNFVNNFSEVSTELIDELKEGPFQKLPDTEKEYAEEILSDLIQNLTKITHHGQRASSIVKGMLEHSRATTGERQLTDINQLADEYLRLAYHGAKVKDSNFNSDYKLIFDDNLPLINVVPQEIGRVLLNLTNNAFYAVHQRAKQGEINYQPNVTVRTELKENQIQLSVQDNGNGIPAAIKNKIFQPFFTTKPTGEGTGLGLSLSYDIITKGHGGTIDVETKKGEGTTFIVTVPINF